MNTLFVFRNLKSNYCKAVFLISLFVGYFLIPKDVLSGHFKFIALAFVIIFSLTMACVARTIKEKVKTSLSLHNSFLGILASVIGISALQVCGLGVPSCGASIGAGVLSIIFPGFVFNYLREYSVLILTLSVFFQLYSLFRMNCFSLAKQNY